MARKKSSLEMRSLSRRDLFLRYARSMTFSRSLMIRSTGVNTRRAGRASFFLEILSLSLPLRTLT